MWTELRKGFLWSGNHTLRIKGRRDEGRKGGKAVVLGMTNCLIFPFY